MPEHIVVGRLFLSVILGGLVGLEREMHGRAAGFRTHILVCTGATLIMLVSVYGFPGGHQVDQARLAAQVVSGVGFLGAGTILREGESIRGLTTAASLWVVAGIGLAVGVGFYLGASATTLLVMITLLALHRLEHRYIVNHTNTIEIKAIDRVGLLGQLAAILGDSGGNIRAVTMHEEQGEMKFVFSVDRLPSEQVNAVLEKMRNIDGVIVVNYR